MAGAQATGSSGAMKALRIEPSLCTGCKQCELACSWIQTGVFQPSRSTIRVHITCFCKAGAKRVGVRGSWNDIEGESSSRRNEFDGATRRVAWWVWSANGKIANTVSIQVWRGAH